MTPEHNPLENIFGRRAASVNFSNPICSRNFLKVQITKVVSFAGTTYLSAGT
jgi:hypothetical protein